MEDNRSFVIGSLPLCRFEPTKNEWLSNPFGRSERCYEFFLPLAPKLGFLLSGKENSNVPIGLPSDYVDKINQTIEAQSDAIVSQDEREIRRVIKTQAL